MHLILFLLASTYLAVPGECRITVTIPPGVSLSREEVAAKLPVTVRMRGGYDVAEIVIYHYTRGVERYHYGGDGSFEETLSSGDIECLVKLKKKGRLTRALFIHAGGPDRAGMLDSLSRALTDALALL